MKEKYSFTPLSGSSESDLPRSGNGSSAHNDRQLLDAYSQAVIHVVETVTPAVVSVTGEGSGSGSGFVLESEGLAITNSHVVGGRQKLIAMTEEGDRIDASLVGEDPATDIALLDINASDLPSARLGHSAGLRVGQLVIAIGSPLGLSSTVSTGIVSAKGRAMRGQDGRLIENIVQHSAPINPGNSGGPLVDSQGNVIGVNTAIIAMAQGLGFAVPSDTTSWVIEEIRAHGQVRRRQLGIVASARKISMELVRNFDLLSDHAIEVIDLEANGSAARSDIRIGDLILNINGRDTSSVDDVHRLLNLIPKQTPLVLEVLRKGNRLQIQLER